MFEIPINILNIPRKIPFPFKFVEVVSVLPPDLKLVVLRETIEERIIITPHTISITPNKKSDIEKEE